MKEDALHKDINTYLSLTIRGDNDFYTYMPFGEKRNVITGALLKAKGTARGVPDFMILRRFDNKPTEIIWLEAKVGKNKQSLEQKDFQKKCKNSTNERYYVVYSLDDVVDIIH